MLENHCKVIKCLLQEQVKTQGDFLDIYLLRLTGTRRCGSNFCCRLNNVFPWLSVHGIMVKCVNARLTWSQSTPFFEYIKKNVVHCEAYSDNDRD